MIPCATGAYFLITVVMSDLFRNQFVSRFHDQQWVMGAWNVMLHIHIQFSSIETRLNRPAKSLFQSCAIFGDSIH